MVTTGHMEHRYVSLCLCKYFKSLIGVKRGKWVITILSLSSISGTPPLYPCETNNLVPVPLGSSMFGIYLAKGLSKSTTSLRVFDYLKRLIVKEFSISCSRSF